MNNNSIKYQAVLFDFDGVILDSVQVKTHTFAAMFRQYGPDVEKAVVDYHLAHGGVSRLKKFEHFYKQFLKITISKTELQDLSDVFSKRVLQGVLDSPYIPGALETLENLKKQHIPCFVVSGTPEEEIQHIVMQKQLGAYFKEIHGSPREKPEIIKDILTRYDFDAEKCLFVGDAMTDYNAAQKCGMNFLGIVSDNDFSPFPPNTLINNCVTF